MRIAEQTFRVSERTTLIAADHPVEHLFQVFVKGRLQDPATYHTVGDGIDFGFDCLVPGDVVQIFYLLP